MTNKLIRRARICRSPDIVANFVQATSCGEFSKVWSDNNTSYSKTMSSYIFSIRKFYFLFVVATSIGIIGLGGKILQFLQKTDLQNTVICVFNVACCLSIFLLIIYSIFRRKKTFMIVNKHTNKIKINSNTILCADVIAIVGVSASSVSSAENLIREDDPPSALPWATYIYILAHDSKTNSWVKYRLVHGDCGPHGINRLMKNLSEATSVPWLILDMYPPGYWERGVVM